MLRNSIPILLAYLLSPLVFAGCAEGPLWRTGRISPWVQKKWQEEAMIVPTLDVRKKQLQQSVDASLQGGTDSMQKMANMLAEIVQKDPILLLRIEATKLLGLFPVEFANDGLIIAMNDAKVDVRKAAVEAWSNISGEAAVENLQKLAAGDTNTDVRQSATRALGTIDTASSVRALGLVLDDPSPGVQYRATNSLKEITGEKFGTDIAAWRQYVSSNFAKLPDSQMQNGSTESRMANQKDAGFPIR